MILLIVCVWVMCGLAGAWLGPARGHEAGSGVLMGVLLGPLGLLALAVGPRGHD